MNILRFHARLPRVKLARTMNLWVGRYKGTSFRCYTGNCWFIWTRAGASFDVLNIWSLNSWYAFDSSDNNILEDKNHKWSYLEFQIYIWEVIFKNRLNPWARVRITNTTTFIYVYIPTSAFVQGVTGRLYEFSSEYKDKYYGEVVLRCCCDLLQCFVR